MKERARGRRIVPVALGDLGRSEAQLPHLAGPENPALLVLDPEIGGQVGSTDAVGVVEELFTYVRAHGRGCLGSP